MQIDKGLRKATVKKAKIIKLQKQYGLTWEQAKNIYEDFLEFIE